MLTNNRSPIITNITWGQMEVEGLGLGRDFKLYPGGGREWDWNETGTRHFPGIQPADVEELIQNGSKIIVLTRGMELMLQTQQKTLQFIKEFNIPVYIDETLKAVDIYNSLTETKLVGGLFHSTC